MVTPAALLSKFGIVPDVNSLPHSRYHDSWCGAVVGTIGHYDVLVRRGANDLSLPGQNEVTYIMYDDYSVLMTVTEIGDHFAGMHYTGSMDNPQSILSKWADLVSPYVTPEVIAAIFKIRTPYGLEEEDDE